MLAEVAELRREGFEEPGWDQLASSREDMTEIPSRARYRYVSELYLAGLLYYTNKFGDELTSEARGRLLRWAYGLRTELLRVQMISVNNHAKGDRSAFVLLRNAEKASEIRLLTAEVKGRGQNPDHERKLLALLNGLEG